MVVVVAALIKQSLELIPCRFSCLIYSCAALDYIKLFIHLTDEGVNELTPWNSLLCGHLTNQSYYSASRLLVLQFHSTPNRPLSKSQEDYGFVGQFRFLNSSKS